MICLHLNDDPSDNRAENLRWGTHRDNVDDMFRNGGKRAAVPKPLLPMPPGFVLAASPGLLLSLGSGEVFRLVDEVAGYRVSSRGRVQSCMVSRAVRGGFRGERETVFADSWHDLKPTFVRSRYYHIDLCGGPSGRGRFRRYVHDLVLTAFVGPRPPKMHCRHLNGDGADNRLENLAWGTPAENIADKVTHGTVLTGERNHAAKLSEAKAEEIRLRYAAGECRVSLAKEFGVSVDTIWRVGAGLSWMPELA